MSGRLAALVLLAAGARLFASPACAECHAAIYQKQRITHHAQALRPFAGSRMALALEAAPVKDGNLRFTYRQSRVLIDAENTRAEAPLGWAFGAGAQGFTAVGDVAGRYFEHRVSYFTLPGRPGVTPGQPDATPRTANAALGVLKTPEEAYLCFRCHSTDLRRDAQGGPDLSTLTPGLSCERCHGPGTAHIEAARQRAPLPVVRKAIFSAAHLPAKASVEVCGECHRTKASLADPVTIRFQPVGLMAAKCFERSGTLSCVTCHDPHEDAARHDDAFYNAKCMSCHAQCPTGRREDCLACHMRRVALSPSLVFTDHRIRVY